MKKYDDDLELYYFNEEFPFALKYGMTPHQFWEEDKDLFYVYQKAYTDKIHEEAFLNGRYVYDAISMVISNCFKGKNDKPIEYYNEDVYNPFKTLNTKTGNYINTLDTKKNNNALNNLKERFKRKE